MIVFSFLFVLSVKFIKCHLDIFAVFMSLNN